MITLKSNSAIVALTNGFHGRKSFDRIGERIILFHQFNRSFTKLSFLNFVNYFNFPLFIYYKCYIFFYNISYKIVNIL